MMSPKAWPFAVAVVLAFTGCETTGDPTQGGLFGWSEAKAKERIAKKEEELAAARGELREERQTGASLDRAAAGSRARLTHAHAEAAAREAEEAQFRADIANLRRRLEQIETDSPTSSGASRARALQAQLTRVGNAGSISINERRQRLETLETSASNLSRQLGLQ